MAGFSRSFESDAVKEQRASALVDERGCKLQDPKQTSLRGEAEEFVKVNDCHRLKN